MEVCYAYDGIGRVIMDMQAADWAAWIGAIGTVVAAWSVFVIYSRARKDAKEDLRSRRKVLHAVLGQHVVATANSVQTIKDRLFDEKFINGEPAIYIALTGLSRPSRLLELQSELFTFAAEGDEAIAAFIEACRGYQETHRTAARISKRNDPLPGEEQEEVPFAVQILRVAIGRVVPTVQPALDAVSRFDAHA
jgi:hypothetical protein